MKNILSLFIGFILFLPAGAQNYYVYVTAESEDEVAIIKFDGEKAETIKEIPVGVWPAEIEGPHGITVSPDKKYWYLSLAHGNPWGFLYKFSTETNEVVGKTELGLFPASMQISEATGLLYCVNFNLHGDMVPSSVSVVDPETMTELKKIETGVMPHGSRISKDGLRQYSVGMMSGELFEINTLSLKVSRILNLDKNEPKSMKKGMEMKKGNMDHSKMDHSKMGHAGGSMNHSAVKPTWVIPHPNGKVAYVAGNGSDEILEIDLDKWKIVKRYPGGKGPYNVEVTPDGSKFIVTYKSDGSTGIWDTKKGKELARLTNSNKVSHGVAISEDSKYAFISVEGIGGDPGTVDVIDLRKLKIVDTAYLGKQAGGIIFWKQE